MMKYETLQMKAIDFIKTNRVMIPVYKKLKTRNNTKKINLNNINFLTPVSASGEETRFNLVLPTLRKTRVFAGISSAISFFLKVAGKEARCRIIVISNEQYSEKTTYYLDGFEHNTDSKYSLLFACDNHMIEVEKNDVFLFTSWKTAYSFFPVLRWQKKEYDIPDRKAIYLIQDYEPGFFAWSTGFVLAESTYSSDPNSIIAVFNSKQLYDYFKAENYSFFREYYFKPSLNKRLKEILLLSVEKGEIHKKRDKRILIYGRPSEDRNAFELIKYSLEQWSKLYPKAKEWEIVSLGEGFEDIKLEYNTIKSFGKVSLDDYAGYLLSSYVGISLMVSPHPSYPPLEMSTFGIRTITNEFATKNLSTFNENIVSLKACSPHQIVEQLSSICDEYDYYNSNVELNHEYLEENDITQVAIKARNCLLNLND